jgi:hypothetical protein
MTEKPTLGHVTLTASGDEYLCCIKGLHCRAGNPVAFHIEDSRDRLLVEIYPDGRNPKLREIAGFTIEIPARRYTKDRLLEAIFKEGSRRLSQLLIEFSGGCIGKAQALHQAELDKLQAFLIEVLKE